MRKLILKGKNVYFSLNDSVVRFFASGFFKIIFPRALDNNIGVMSNFRKFAEIFASQGAPVSTNRW